MLVESGTICPLVLVLVLVLTCGSGSVPRLVMDDGTAEAHVWLSGQPVQAALGLADSQWAGLQRAVRVRGQVQVFPGGRSLVSSSLLSDWLSAESLI